MNERADPFLNKLILRFYNHWKTQVFCARNGVKIDMLSLIEVDRESTLLIKKGSSIRRSRIVLRNGAKLVIGANWQAKNAHIDLSNSTVSIGTNFRISGYSLSAAGQSIIEIGNNCLIEKRTSYDGFASVNQGSVRILDSTAIRGSIRVDPNGNLQIGHNSFINHGSEIRCGESITIGNFVYISYFCDVFDTNTHPTDASLRRGEQDPNKPNITKTNFNMVRTKPVVIEDDVWVGKHASILKGCCIGKRSIIGTRSVATGIVPPDSTAVGNPAKVTRTQRATS